MKDVMGRHEIWDTNMIPWKTFLRAKLVQKPKAFPPAKNRKRYRELFLAHRITLSTGLQAKFGQESRRRPICAPRSRPTREHALPLDALLNLPHPRP